MRNMLKLAMGTVLLTASTCAMAQAPYGPPRPPSGQGGDDWRYNNGPGSWNPGWDQRPNPGRGACFYSDANFRGHRFCIRAGDRIGQMPGNFNDRISSIQTFGGAKVRVFHDRDFRGKQAQFPSSISDLSRVRAGSGPSWNDQISSIVVAR